MLKHITYTGTFADATCGLVHPSKDEYTVGCGRQHSLEHFEYTLEDGKTRSTVALCPKCAAQQMKHRRVSWAAGSAYDLYVGDTQYGRAKKELGGGWSCRVSVAGQETSTWARTLGELEADALVWYRFFTKGMN